MPAPVLTARIEAELCAALRGEGVEPLDPPAFAAAAVDEGLAPLLLDAGGLRGVPPAADEILRTEVRRQLGLAAVRETELRRVLADLAAAGVEVLLFKGAHLAYALYPHPALRPRLDTDLLVRPGARDAATRALESLGYQRRPLITGDAVQGQAIFETPALASGLLDVHWRLASPVVAAALLSFDELWHDSTALPALGPAARGPSLPDAMAIAAVHQAAHHAAEPRLAWRYDVHRLLAALTDEALEGFAERARTRGMSAICGAAVRAAEERFPSARGARLLPLLEGAADRSAALLTARTPHQQALMDLRALHGWRARGAYVAAHLFPPADYMRATYARASRAPLPWLYARRILTGARRWF